MPRREFIKEKRQIRVFISSSFEDMDDERNYLRDEVFPRLQEKALRRSVAITALDLRWGIPNGTDLGETIEICMREIDNSYPFFIGLLGGHYGTQPEKKVYDASSILQEQFQVLEGYFNDGLSITEMEMRYGILDRSEEERKKMDALFFIRASDYDEIKKSPRLNHLWEDIKINGEPYTRNPERNCDHCIWTDEYNDLSELGDTIERVFDAILDRIYPEMPTKDALQIERNRQLAVVAELSRFYVPNIEWINKINDFIFCDTFNLLEISGQSGLGKSSLLAYWIRQNEDFLKSRGYFVLYHFVGIGDGECSNDSLLKRLCCEIYGLYGVSKPSGADYKLDVAFNELVSQRNLAEQKLVIIVDAINQLEGIDSREWLPYSLPAGVKIIYSTIGGQLKPKGKLLCDFLTLSEITRPYARREIINAYLLNYHRRRLEEEYNDLIVKWPLAGNPFALRVLLDELLIVGRYDKMGAIIQEYTRAICIDDLLTIILKRVSSMENYTWVSDALRYLSISLYGLSENEILRLVDTHPIYWSSFYCSFRRHFIIRNGLLSFSHAYIKGAVMNMFVRPVKDIASYHKNLIQLFKKNETLREAEELYHHCVKADVFDDSLFHLVSQPRNFIHFWEKDSTQLTKVFSELLKQGFPCPALAVRYEDLVLYDQDDGTYFGSYGKAVISLCQTFSITDEFLRMYGELNHWFDEEGMAAMDWCPIHQEAGYFYFNCGRYRQAISAYKHSFIRDTSGGRLLGYSDDEEPVVLGLGAWLNAYYMIGECYRRLGEYDLAISFLNKALDEASDIMEEGARPDGLANIFLSLYKVYVEKGDNKIADEYLNKCYDQTGLVEAIAEFNLLIGRPRRSFVLFHDQLKKHRALVDSNNIMLGIDYYWIGRSYFSGGLVDLAVKCLSKALSFFEGKELTEIHIADTEFYLGKCFYKFGEYQEAIKHYRRAGQLYKSLEAYPQWILSSRAIGIMLINAKQVKEARMIFEHLINALCGKQYCTPYRDKELQAIVTNYLE